MKVSKNIKITGVIVAIVLVASLPFLVNYLKSISDYQAKVASLTISDVNVTTIPDGTYTGECDADFIYAKVEVIVLDGRIVAVNLIEHKNERGKAAEDILNRMIDEQSIDVDAISSATNSSKVIKKAVEDALLSGTSMH